MIELVMIDDERGARGTYYLNPIRDSRGEIAALERYLNDPAAIRRARAYREAFEARAVESAT